MTFSIMITTRNRCDDLRRTLERLQQLQPAPLEVLVCADGCTDDTVSFVSTHFPAVRFRVHAQGLGSVGSRDRLLREAKGDWVLSLDDDSYPVADDFFARVQAIVDSHPEAAVITFPELRDVGFASARMTPESPGHYVSAYPNCAALMRREFYLCQPGFPPPFVHTYEEPDYALQCYAAGAAVWFEPSLTIRHHLSARNRSSYAFHHQNARNELWSVWMRCPWPWLPIVALFRVWRQFRYAITEGWSWAVREPLWWGKALAGIMACCRQRRPVAWARYLAWMKLARQAVHSVGELRYFFYMDKPGTSAMRKQAPPTPH